MKIVQSYWSKPTFSRRNDGRGGRQKGGWRNAKYNYLSWALSCYRLKQHYSTVELVTDRRGKELLIDVLDLPYDKVVVALDALNHYPEQLWAVGKIYTYSLQKVPFLHVDNDVFIWESFDLSARNNRLVCQNEEINFPHDIAVLEEMFNNFDYLPQAIKDHPPSGSVQSINAGVLGGSDTSFFQEYTRQSFAFINASLDKLSYVNTEHANVIFEQYLFACLAQSGHQEVTSILHGLGNQYLRHLCDFAHTPYRRKYVHIIGPYKRYPASEQWLEDRLRLEFPDVYYNISSLIEDYIL